MHLSSGTRLGPYEVLAAIGAGGMGEVYRARDTKLGRDVALKILPEAFAHDADRMTRFEREAQVLASLNHPNIAAIYGLEESTNVRALVMELVDGPTLAERIGGSSMPLEEALPIAKQIAEALEYAHERGIIHRDLKPANVKLTADGNVKVLDFGLAKALEAPAPAAGNRSISTTVAMEGTRAGVILGTAAYMAPEQARGAVLDKRADIWSFGVVLYEMLTGKQLFHGETVSDTLAAVLKEEPDFSQVPALVRRLLKSCLQKEPKQRLQAIGDSRLLLEDNLQVVAPRRGLLPWALAAGFAVAFSVASFLLYQATRPAPLQPLMSLNIDLEDNTPLARTGGNEAVLALSSDGTRLALTLRGADGKVRLHTRRLNQSQITPLADTENASYPFFSPNDEWIGFFADGKLKKISLEGSGPVTLCDAPAGRGASWGDDGTIIAALNPRGVLSRIPSVGGAPVAVTKLNPDEVTHRFPQVLPGGRTVLFTASTHGGGYDDANIDVVSLKTGERRTVQRGGYSPHYLAQSNGRGSNGTGHLIYLHQSTLFAVPFDPYRLALTGAPVPILEDVGSDPAAGRDFAVGGAPSGHGSFVYLTGKGQAGAWPISWVDSSGKTEPLHAPRGLYFTPRFSPDGKRLAFSLSGNSDDIWVKDLDRDTPSRLSFLPGQNRWPVWTPDGKNIVFQSTNPAAPGLYLIRSDGSGEAQRLTNGKSFEAPYSFSPDGKRLAFMQGGNASMDIFTAPLEGDPSHPRLGKAELFLGTPFTETNPAFSPDGRWLAYSSNESGNAEVYVRPFPGPGGRWQISTGGGRFPLWSHDGRELFFATLDRRVMAVSYTAKGDSFVADKPRVWSETRLVIAGTFSQYDVAPDGKRLAAMLVSNEAIGQKPVTHLTFLLNFSDELQRRAPAGGK